MSELSLKSVRKTFGALEVIKGVDLEIEKGEFTVFVGPSGCGKSTLLRMIAGLEDISAGDLMISGTRMNDTDPSKRGIAMVFQSYALYPHLTVRQNMGFALRFAGVPKAEIEKQVMDAARILELEKLLDDASRGSNAVLTVDLEAQEITGPDGGKISFSIDAFKRHCLLNGLDDIGLTLEKASAIDAFEKKTANARPWA